MKNNVHPDDLNWSKRMNYGAIGQQEQKLPQRKQTTSISITASIPSTPRIVQTTNDMRRQ